MQNENHILRELMNEAKPLLPIEGYNNFDDGLVKERKEYLETLAAKRHKIPSYVTTSRGTEYAETLKSVSTSGARRDALGLPYFKHIPLEALAAGAAALHYGEQKYEARNWEKGLPWQQLIDSLKRHVEDFERRQDFDDGPDGSDLPQVCMIMASAMMLCATVIRGAGDDDRLVETPDNALSSKECAQWIKEQLNAARAIEKG